jgi:hypothetical protein
MINQLSEGAAVKNRERLKSRLLRSVHDRIYRFWVDPLQHIVRRLEGQQAGVGHWLRRVALWGVNLGRLAITDFRVTLWRLSGPEGSVVYVGAGFSLEELRHILFAAPPAVAGLRRAFLWHAPALACQYAMQGDLVVYEQNTIARWRPRHGQVFVVPRWISQTLDIARPLPDILVDVNQNMRRALRKVEKRGFSYVFTQDRVDFDLFYHHMYRPYIQQRYGARAIVSSYHELNRLFAQGGLILVRRDTQPVCAMLCAIVGDTCKAGPMGVHESRFDEVGEGSNVALWWFMLDWARSRGLRRFDFGASRAQTANGAFNFKRQWGTRVGATLDLETEWLFYAENIPSTLRARLNQQGLITQKDGLHYRVWLLDPGVELSDADWAAWHDEAARCGLAGVLAIAQDSERMSMKR